MLDCQARNLTYNIGDQKQAADSLGERLKMLDWVCGMRAWLPRAKNPGYRINSQTPRS